MVNPKIIQGGMGVAVSSWKLARAVSEQGQLGVVSGTGITIVLIARLMQGDKDGIVREALAHFPLPDIAQRIVDTYFVEGGIAPGVPFKRATMWSLNPPADLEELTVAANFVEVWLAKQGHNNPVGINLLEKVQLPMMASLYGAMLAGVDYVIVGAGIPTQIPGILDKLATHEAVSYRVDVLNESADDESHIHFDPMHSFSGVAEAQPELKRPLFLPIVSSVVLAKALQKRSSGEINGLIVEMPSAGGHNAPPRVKDQLNERGEPLYTEKDAVNVKKIASIGLPFWLAGGYGTAEKLQEALDSGAEGVQVGTAFAFCDESGMADTLKTQVIEKAQNDTLSIFTDPLASPTGFPFKVVQVEGTVSEQEIYTARPRICDLGFLRQMYRDSNNTVQFRCAAAPIENYVKKGGTLGKHSRAQVPV